LRLSFHVVQLLEEQRVPEQLPDLFAGPISKA